MAIFVQLEGSDKEILSLYICSYYVRKDSLHYYKGQNWMVVSRELQYVEGRLESQTSCLQMTIIFCKAMGGEVEVINEVLQIYANASGQCINMEKSSVYFSSNT